MVFLSVFKHTLKNQLLFHQGALMLFINQNISSKYLVFAFMVQNDLVFAFQD